MLTLVTENHDYEQSTTGEGDFLASRYVVKGIAGK